MKHLADNKAKKRKPLIISDESFDSETDKTDVGAPLTVGFLYSPDK